MNMSYCYDTNFREGRVMGKWSGPDGWEHEVGSRLYTTTDGRGEVRVVPGNSPFSMLYEAWLDGKKIGQRATRTLAFRLVEASK
jgi:hypothetical protein